jgi:hypothetical protein
LKRYEGKESEALKRNSSVMENKNGKPMKRKRLKINKSQSNQSSQTYKSSTFLPYQCKRHENMKLIIYKPTISSSSNYSPTEQLNTNVAFM